MSQSLSWDGRFNTCFHTWDQKGENKNKCWYFIWKYSGRRHEVNIYMVKCSAIKFYCMQFTIIPCYNGSFQGNFIMSRKLRLQCTVQCAAHCSTICILCPMTGDQRGTTTPYYWPPPTRSPIGQSIYETLQACASISVSKLCNFPSHVWSIL